MPVTQLYAINVGYVTMSFSSSNGERKRDVAVKEYLPRISRSSAMPL